MSTARRRAWAPLAALLTAALVAGTATFGLSRGDGDPPATTTTTLLTTTTRSAEELAAAVGDVLARQLPVTVTDAEAACLGAAVTSTLGLERLEALAAAAAPLAELTPVEREDLLRGVVSCLPADRAEALLGSPSTSTSAAQLPDEPP